MQNPTIPIRIPTGIFSGRKETMSSALYLTIAKLKEIVSKDVVTANYIDDILNREGIYYEFERSLPESFRHGL